MVLKLIDRKIREAFSDAAAQYDVLTGMHKEIGRELIKKITFSENSGGQMRILDIGMGTGRLTKRLARYFPDAEVTGMDFAPGMIDAAKKEHEGFHIVQADARRLPFKNTAFDAVVSNLAFQWVGNLTEVFARVLQVLKPEGQFCATMFAAGTFEELFCSLESSGRNIQLRRLASRNAVETALQESGFCSISLKQERITTHFADMKALLQWARDIGANGLTQNIFLGKEAFLKASDYYVQNFSGHLGIRASFEVLWMEALK